MVDVKIFREEKVVGTSFLVINPSPAVWKKKKKKKRVCSEKSLATPNHRVPSIAQF